MSKDLIGLTIADVSDFARRLAPQLKNHEGQPSHLTFLNMMARAAGFRNYQHLRASHKAQVRLSLVRTDADIDFRLVERALHQFDGRGRMLRWPSRRPVQEICLWVLWSQLPTAAHLHEREVNAILNGGHLFGDSALLRRSLVGLALLQRNLDGSEYRRLEKRPPDTAQEVIARVKDRQAARADAL